MEGYAVRITMPYNTLPKILDEWKDLCDQIIVYEHPAPPASRQHCHLLVVNPSKTSKTFKDRSGLANGGNALWTWKNLKPRTRESALKYVRYMTKGKYDPKFLGGRIQHISAEDCAKEKALWITYNPTNVITRSKSHKAYLAWLEEWGNDPLYTVVKIGLGVPSNADEVYINMIRQHAERWLIGENEGFYNQQVANQKINFVRSFLFEINYRP